MQPPCAYGQSRTEQRQSLLGALRGPGSARYHQERDNCKDPQEYYRQEKQHTVLSTSTLQFTSRVCSNRPGGRKMPPTLRRSRNLGRMPLGWKAPTTLPSGPMPLLLKLKISCMLITFSSMPVISEMLTTLRLPSLMREICTTRVMADAI